MKKFIVLIILLLAVLVGCSLKNPQIVTETPASVELARSGCCSWHDGVCGCDSISGMIKCCDGTLSPT